MIMPVTSTEYLAKPACAPMATDKSAIPTTSMLTPLSREARGQARERLKVVFMDEAGQKWALARG